MKRIEHIAMIAHDMGLIFEFLGFVSLLPFLVLVIFREWDMLLPVASAPFVFLVLGGLLSRVSYEDLEPSFSGTLIAVAFSWLAIALIGALPFVFGLNMSYTDSIFEAMSGWTGTGFTMITSLDTTPKNAPFLAILYPVDRGDWYHCVRHFPATEDPGLALPVVPGRRTGRRAGNFCDDDQPADVDDLSCPDLCIHRDDHDRGNPSLGFAEPCHGCHCHRRFHDPYGRACILQ